MNLKVSIIILNWNGWEDTIECLESLYQITYPNYDVIVVDNGSEDDSIEKIKEYCEGKIKVESKFFGYFDKNKPIKIIEYTREEAEAGGGKENEITDIPPNRKLILIKNEKNYGFAEGNNIAMRYALKALNPDYVLLLNNDTVVDKEFLGELVKVGEGDEKVGIVGPKICYYDTNGRSDVISALGGKINWRKYPGYYHIGKYLVDSPENSTGAIECDWVSGAVMMIRSKAMPNNLLNTDFFFGCEDVDLCIRLKDHGYKMVAVLNSKIWHKGGVSRKKKYPSILRGIIRGTHTNFQFLKTHNKRFIFFLPLYILQIIKMYSSVMSTFKCRIKAR